MTFIRKAALLAGLVLVAALPARAQDYPSHPVTIVVPTGPGGAMDVLGRMYAQRLEKHFGKPFVIENRPGAGTNIGAAAAARAAPDGYTLMIATSSTMAINVSIYKSLAYDPTKDLEPLLLICRVPFVMVANTELPVKSAGDLVTLAKAKPGTLTFGSAGVGTASHLFAELFKSETGIQVTHVPYKSTVQPLTDLVAGHLQFMFSDLPPSLGLIRGGKLRALGISAPTRVDVAPEIPTIAEAGVPGYEALSWLMVVGRAGTPPAIVDALHMELKAIMTEPQVLEQIKNSGLLAADSPPPAELERFVKSEIGRWSKVVAQAGATGIE